MIEAHQRYVEVALKYLDKARLTLESLKQNGLLGVAEGLVEPEIQDYMRHADRQISQIQRRVMGGEIIAHEKKILSIFEPHTEWISKGKAGVPVELGLRVCVLEDHYRFLLHHCVMEQETDDQVAVLMAREAQKRFPALATCSFDKGFHSPGNQQQLREMLEVAALPRKGRRSQAVQEWEASPEFQQARNKHSAVESAINALEVHGLDRCPDRGVDGYKRYVALSIVARNLQRIGAILIDRERKRLERQRTRQLKQAA